MSKKPDDTDLTLDSVEQGDREGAERLSLAVSRAGGPTIVARRSGLHVRAIHHFLKGRSMKRADLALMAEACEVRINWLVTGDGPMLLHQDPATLTITGQGDTSGQIKLRLQTFVNIKRYDVRASAGPGDIVESEKRYGSVALDKDFIRQVLHRRRDDLVSIEARGDSMEPTIHDGEVLIVDVSVKEVQNGCVYLLRVNDDLLVKRLSLRMDGSVMVRSDNDKYEPEAIQPSERTTLHVVGQVVYKAGPVRS